MSQNKKNNSQYSENDLPVHVIEQYLEGQKQHIINKAHELKLREKEMDLNAKLGEQQMNLQAELLKVKPAETRKNIILIGVFIVVIIFVFLFFFGALACNGHEEFAIKIFGYLMYGVVSVASFYAGRKSVKKHDHKKHDAIEDADIVG